MSPKKSPGNCLQPVVHSCSRQIARIAPVGTFSKTIAYLYAMRFADVIGQQLVKQRLLQSVKDERVSHALMFLGPEGSGNLAIALAFAQYLVCENRSDTDSCGTSVSCAVRRRSRGRPGDARDSRRRRRDRTARRRTASRPRRRF